MHPRTPVLLAALLCLAPMRAERAGPPAVLMPFVTVSGAQSHVTEPRCVRVTTADDWAALWLEHVGQPPKVRYDTYYNKAALPVVDFAHCMVVAVFDGATVNCAGVSAVEAPQGRVSLDAATAAGPASADEVSLYLLWHGYQTLDNGPAGAEPPSAADFFGADGGGGGDHVTPFGFFVLPRTSAPLVVRDVQPSMGSDAVRVVERARLPALPDGDR